MTNRRIFMFLYGIVIYVSRAVSWASLKVPAISGALSFLAMKLSEFRILAARRRVRPYNWLPVKPRRITVTTQCVNANFKTVVVAVRFDINIVLLLAR